MASAQILNTGKAMYAWNGTNWVPLNNQFTTVNSTRWQKVMVGGETSLSGNDDNGNTLIYSPGSEQLYLNGILLARDDDYTANDGLTITGLSALPAGGNIEIIAYKQIHFANVYNKDQVDGLIDNIDLSLYLTQSSASSTYLTQSSASTTYEKLIPYSTSTPSSPVTGDMWVDSNTVPPALKVYDGSNWVQLGAAVDDSQAIIAGRMFA
jgi:hypothetical protein